MVQPLLGYFLLTAAGTALVVLVLAAMRHVRHVKPAAAFRTPAPEFVLHRGRCFRETGTAIGTPGNHRGDRIETSSRLGRGALDRILG